MPDPLIIDADPGIAIAFAKGVPTQSPAAARDPDLDIYFDCDDVDINGDTCYGVAVAVASGSKSGLVDLIATATAIAAASGGTNWGNALGNDAATAIAVASGDLLLEGSKRNWVKWSDIGSLVFTINRKNVAGERPLDWKGWVHQVKKLGGKVVVYGENGVSVFTPSGVNWGLQTINRAGIKGKNAVAGNDSGHYFLDNEGQLWSLTDGLKNLDYSEFLDSMYSTVVLSYDEINDLLYICDNNQGFIYREGSLGKGPINITGIGYQDGVSYAVASSGVISRIPEICTDIYDVGTRKGKSIQSLEIGTDLTETLKASIYYRFDKAEAFEQTSWYDVDSRGQVFIPCYGYEFKFGFKVSNYEYFEIDSIKVNGLIHQH